MFEELNKKQKEKKNDEAGNRKDVYSPEPVLGNGGGLKMPGGMTGKKIVNGPKAVGPGGNTKHDRMFDKRMKALHEKGRKRGLRYSIIGITLSVAISAVVLVLGYTIVSEVSLISDKIDERKVADIALADDTNNVCNKNYCCLASLRKIQRNNYLQYSREVGCGDGYRYKKLDCDSSLEWCEPMVGAGKSCAGEGSEYSLATEPDDNKVLSRCCDGLVSSEVWQIDDEQCGYIIDDAGVCVNCANGICGPGENYCNCPADCEESVPEDNSYAGNIKIDKSKTAKDRPRTGLSEIDENWNLYKNYDIGFSMRIPKYVQAGAGLSDGCGELQVVQKDLRTIQITGEKPILECEGENNINCRDVCQFREYKFWQVNSDIELENFLKNIWGQSCSLGEQADTAQDGVYELKITRTAGCAIEGEIFSRYYPDRNIVVSWGVGENRDYLMAGGEYADNEMYNSFIFFLDSDLDGLYDDEEIYYKTDPNIADSDNDGFLDGDEVDRGNNPAGEGKLKNEN